MDPSFLAAPITEQVCKLVYKKKDSIDTAVLQEYKDLLSFAARNDRARIDVIVCVHDAWFDAGSVKGMAF